MPPAQGAKIIVVGATREPKRGLLGRFDQFDVFFQQFVDKNIEGNAARLCGRGQEGEHFGIEVHRRGEDRVPPIETAAFGLREIVFVLHAVVIISLRTRVFAVLSGFVGGRPPRRDSSGRDPFRAYIILRMHDNKQLTGRRLSNCGPAFLVWV